jgi:hypothetical protein
MEEPWFPHEPPPYSALPSTEAGPVAQRSEQRTHNPLVPGSNPGGPIREAPGNQLVRFQERRARGPGIIIGLFLVVGSLEFVGRFEEEGWKLAGAIVPITYIAWSLWLIVSGLVLLVG